MSHSIHKSEQKSELKNLSQSHYQFGFGLIEVMIAVGIMGIIAAGMATLMYNSTRAVQSISATTDFNSLVGTFQAAFNNTGSCLTAFGGAANTNLNPAITPSAPQAVVLNIAGSTIKAGTKYGNSVNIRNLDLIGKKPAGGVNQWVIPLSLVADRTVGNQAAVGGSTISHTFNLVVTVDTNNKIIGCNGEFTDYWAQTAANANDITYMKGNVGIGTSTPAAQLDVTGTVQAVAFMYNSDVRLKENIREIPNVLDRALKLHGVIYDWKNKKNLSKSNDNLGLIAQEVEEIFPEAVTTNPETGMKAVAYGNLIAPMIEALKEQQEIILKQKQEITDIKKILSKNNMN